MCLPPDTATMQPDAGINEAVLAAIWNEQSPLRGPMWDCEGNPVAVVYRGRWTAGSGPDFEGAILSLGGRLVNGSVEMHLRCADWFAHGHHTDPQYNQVQLHVVLWPQAARPVLRADGTTVPTLVLADYITMQPAELLEHVRPTLANLGTLSEEPCWQRTADWPLERLLTPIDRAGEARLQARVAAMEADIEVYGSVDEVFYRGIMDTWATRPTASRCAPWPTPCPCTSCSPCPCAIRRPSARPCSKACCWAREASTPRSALISSR